MYTIENPTGRLLVARIQTPVLVEDLTPFVQLLRTLLAPIPNKVVICTDLLGARVFPPEVADGFVGIMRADNPKLERSGFLVSDSALFSLQVERMIRAAGSDLRRAYREPKELSRWVGELLTLEERFALDRFLGLA